MYRVDIGTNWSFASNGLEGKWRFCLKLLDKGSDSRFVSTGLEGKWRFCLKLLDKGSDSRFLCTGLEGKWRFCLKLLDKGNDSRFVSTGLEGKLWFCLKLLQCCYVKVFTAQCSKCTGWIQGLTAVLLVLGWRGNGGSVWSYCSAVTLKRLQHSAVTVQGGYREWLNFC